MNVAMRRGALIRCENVILHEPFMAGVGRASPFAFLPRALQALRLLAENKIAVRMILQRPVAESQPLSRYELDRPLQSFLLEVALGGGDIEKVYTTPRVTPAPEGWGEELDGLLVQAMDEGYLHPQDTFFVGNSQSDLAAAAMAGCRSMVIRRDAFLQDDSADGSSPNLASSLLEAAERIVRHNVIRFDSSLKGNWIRLATSDSAGDHDPVSIETDPVG